MAAEMERATLMCSTCGTETLQEVHYAGRILTHINCTACGAQVHVADGDINKDYLADLQHRLRTKPRRLWHRATKHPIRFVATLPGAIIRQPVKMLRELRSLKDENTKD